MSIFSSYKKIFLLGFIVIILVAIPFSVYIGQQRQQTKSKASASTSLFLEPATSTINVNDNLTLNIVLDPGAGSPPNQVSFVKLAIEFDPKKFTTANDSLTPQPAPNTLTSILEDAAYDNTAGKASISLSVGADPTRVVTAKTTIAVLKLKAIAATSASSEIKLDGSQVLSIASSDQTSENVLSTTTPAKATINPASPNLTPTPTPAPNPIAASPTPVIANPPGNIQQPAPSPTIVITPTPTVTQPLPTQIVLPPTGPGAKILSIGAIGIILTIIGGALLFF